MAPENRHFHILFSEEYQPFEFLASIHPTYTLLYWMEHAMQFSWDASLRLPNGTITGAATNPSEIDMIIAPVAMSGELWDRIEFNYPYRYYDYTFATIKPRYNPEIMAIFRTLSLSVWIALLVSIVTLTLVSFVALKHRCTLADVLFHVLAVGLNQEGNIVPKRTGEVVLLFTWMLAMLLFSFCFKSVLLSFLSFPPLTGIRTVPELAAAIRSGKFKAYARSPSTGATLMRSPNEDLRVIGEEVLRNGHVRIYDLMKDECEDYAYIANRIDMHAFDQHLFVSDESMAFEMSATIVRKGFCCTSEMDAVVHRFMAAGAHLKAMRLREHVKPELFLKNATDIEDTTLRKITLTDISAAFIFLAAGYFLSACVLVVELWLNSRQKRRSLAKQNNLPLFSVPN